MAGAAAPAGGQRIGRFEIVRVLGKGAQGTVYLARDTHLEREVAVKTLRFEHTDAAVRGQRVRTLLDEARIVSKMQHPNIVTLHDAGEDKGTPYLVFEYVEGSTLATLIREKGRLAPAQAADIALQVLRGVGYAHAKDVIHRDLKPANIIITAQGVPQVMDFGIARHAADVATGERTLYGTPSYMAPEYVASYQYTTVSDLFSIGMVLYEMLTGQPAAKMPTAVETLYRIVNLPFPPPSELNPEIDEKLNGIVVKSIAKDPGERYQSAEQMAEALAAWLEPASEASSEGTQGTLEFLLRRIRHKSDFPALSATIGTLNRVIASSDRERTSVLCNAILKDFGLTTKLLKLVNAAYYNQFGGGVSTVSRAVAILGFDGIRNVAASLMLFEHMQNKAQAAALRDELAATYFSAVLAREFVHKTGVRDAEEAFVCAMFHRLGKLLVAFYLHEEAHAIERLMQSRRIDRERAAIQVLGIPYEDLGMGVARKWNFPDKIVNSMRPVAEALRSRVDDETDTLRALASMANGVSDVVRTDSGPEARARGLAAVVAKFGEGIAVDHEKLALVVDDSVKALSRDAEFLGFNTGRTPFFESVRSWSAERQEAAANDAAATLVDATQLATFEPTGLFGAPGAAAAPSDRRGVLAAGVQDITETLVSSHKLNDVLRIILETMYRGIGFSRVLLCVSDPRHSALRARFGFGHDVDAVVRRGFSIPISQERDVFYAAIHQGLDICIEDINADRIRRHVPEWYRAALRCRGMVLFPIMVGKRPVALIYADTDNPAVLKFKPEELNLLKTLRNQAVLAFRQKT